MKYFLDYVGLNDPLVIQCVPASFVIMFVWFLPESPRYMYQNGRKEEAYAFLTKVSYPPR